MRVLRMCECTDEWAPTHLLSSGSRGILVNIRFPDDTEKVLPLQTQIFFSHMLATSRSRSLTFSHPFSLLRSHSCTLSRIYVFVCVIFLYGVADRRGRRRQHSIGNPGKGGPLWWGREEIVCMCNDRVIGRSAGGFLSLSLSLAGARALSPSYSLSLSLSHATWQTDNDLFLTLRDESCRTREWFMSHIIVADVWPGGACGGSCSCSTCRYI